MRTVLLGSVQDRAGCEQVSTHLNDVHRDVIFLFIKKELLDVCT